MTLVVGEIDQKIKEEIMEFYYEEIEALERRDFQAWLNMVSDDIEYISPIRITERRGDSSIATDMTYFNDDKRSLELRCKKYGTSYAWSEDPPSRYRYHITRIKMEMIDANSVKVKSVVLLYITRIDYENEELISYEREDILRKEGNKWKLAKRRIILDHSLVPRMLITRFL